MLVNVRTKSLTFAILSTALARLEGCSFGRCRQSLAADTHGDGSRFASLEPEAANWRRILSDRIALVARADRGQTELRLPLVFFSCYGAHRDLYSFPSRRSRFPSSTPRKGLG